MLRGMGEFDSLVAGSLIWQARTAAGLSQAELAAAAGTSQTAISEYENSRRQPTLPALLKLIEAAGQELRLRLTDKDDHDEVLAEIEDHLSPAERAARIAQQDRWLRERVMPQDVV